MKIGILTLPLHTNYGGILQAYALQTVLERMGHEVVVFDTPKKMWLSRLANMFFRTCTFLKQENKCNLLFASRGNLQQAVISHDIVSFLKNQIKRREVACFDELKPDDYDAIVVGSDQVWRPIYFPAWNGQLIENAFLAFAQDWNIKRIAYAASFGTDNWEYSDEQTKKCGKLLKDFDAVSSRETNGVKLCKMKFDVNAQHVLDPTMLLDIEDYKCLFKKANTPKSRGTLLNYVLDATEKINNLIDNVAIEKHLIPFAVNNPFEHDGTKSLQQRIKPSVETWLRGFYDAEFVITDSFHACVFSILFKKQFVVVGNKERGMSRFESLLKMFGLEDRLVDESTEIEKLKFIDYIEVFKKLDVLRSKSIGFLKQNLL